MSVSKDMAVIVGGCVALTALATCTLSREGTMQPAGHGSAGQTTGSGGGALAGSGGSGSGAQAATAGTATGTDGGGPVTGAENCLNGLDDDGDTLVDCSDPDCSEAGYHCVAAATGALSYVALVSSSASCPAPGEATQFPSCQDCSCTAYGGTCSVGYFFWYESTCSGDPDTVSGAGCHDQIISIDPLYVTAPTTAAGDAVCSAPAPSVPASPIHGCQVTDPGFCDGALVCVPPSFAGVQVCILLPPSSPCPPSYSAERQVDLNGSTCFCACEPGAQVCETPWIRSYPYFDCAGTQTTFTLDAACKYIGDPPSFEIPGSVKATVSCTASGTVSDSTETATLCCL